MSLREPVLAVLDAADTFSEPVALTGPFNFSLWGDFAATVTVQRSFDGGATWLDTATFTAPTELVGFEPEGASYRCGIKAGQYDAGAANTRLGR